MFKKLLKTFCYIILAAMIIFGLYLSFKSPSHDRDWTVDQAVLAHAEIKGDIAAIHNIRNFRYESTDKFTPGYYDKSFNLEQIKKVYYIVEPFSGFRGAAHTFLSFEFEGDQFVSISVEIRKEKGESFSAVKGLFREYELVYVIADEQDVVKLRSNYRKDKVYVYPVKTTTENAKKLFLDMLLRANAIKEKPEFYNTLTNTCTTNLVAHVNEIIPGRIPFSLKILMPAHSDELAREIGLIDQNISIEELRAKYKINERALRYADDPQFSVRIREGI